MKIVIRTLAALLLFVGFSFSVSSQEKIIEYRLGGGDSLRITVFQNPNLTLETRVAADGTIAYPLIGRIRIGDLTIAGAERAIAAALERGNYIRDPQVTIMPLEIRSNQVSVLGLVNRPGRFPLETFNVRLSEMIAIAGGISPGGADVAILTGRRDGKAFRSEVDIPSLFLEGDLEQDILVASGDVIYVHRAPMYYIYGQVHRPGSYRVERGMTVRQALVQGGGPTERGTERSVRLHRRTPGGNILVRQPSLDEAVRADDVLHIGDSIF